MLTLPGPLSRRRVRVQVVTGHLAQFPGWRVSGVLIARNTCAHRAHILWELILIPRPLPRGHHSYKDTARHKSRWGWGGDQEGRPRSVQRHRRGSPRGWREPEGAVSPAALGASDRRILGNSARPGAKGSSGCGLVCPTAQLLSREPLAQPASTHGSCQSPRPEWNGADAGGGGTLTWKKLSPTPTGAIRAH